MNNEQLNAISSYILEAELTKLKLKANAKINLTLDILSRRSDSYHEVSTVMQEISLFDEVSVELTDNGFVLKCSNPDIPVSEKNTCFKAVMLFCEKYDVHKNVIINITKHIPCEAGLGGGSADAAAVLKAMNILFETNATDGDLEEIAAKIGADVAFFIKGGLQLAQGIGEKLVVLPSFSKQTVLIVKPKVGISTKIVYELFDKMNNEGKITEKPITQDFIKALNENSTEVHKYLSNMLTQPACSMIEEIQKTREILIDSGAAVAQMSGSGTAVFGFFEHEKDILLAEKIFTEMGYFTKICRTIGS